MRAVVGLLTALLVSVPVFAESAWVSDEFEVTLRTGPSTSNAIQLMVSSGTALETLEEDAESGYTKVRTGGGTEGWVLTRYLMGEPSAREQLENLTQQLTSAAADGASTEAQLAAIHGEYDSANRRIRELEQGNATLQSDLDEITQKSANTLAIDRQNQNLQQQLTDVEIKASILEQENQEISSQQTRYWFLSGALVLLVGIIAGLWLPRVRWQRQSRYDSF